MKIFSGEMRENTIRYSYDEFGRLIGKQLPGGNYTDYRYNAAGKLEDILHKGADFTERCHYSYDVMGNKVMAEKERPGLPEDSGSFSYCYDALNRLTTVAQNGQTLRTYSYDAFGNRSSKTEYQTAGELVTTYHYNARNQLLQETNANGTKDYAYDHRGNLLSVTSGEEVLRAYGFDAANQMNSSMGMTDGQIKKAVYQYNGLGHRMEQSIAAGDAAPEQTIRYTLDLTRQYHNLLQKRMWSRPTSGMVMSREWKKKEGSTFIFRMIWKVRCGLQMKQEEVRKPMDLMNLVMISERQKISLRIPYRALVLQGIRWIVQEGCILHRQEDMMPEQAVS